ncbi:MAG: hypothetical protein PF637_09940 [Spirochaetes bacterium]|jgi:hypothetical protein|nr:hypothetical protein [Spirochaetota bacterium]
MKFGIKILIIATVLFSILSCKSASRLPDTPSGKALVFMPVNLEGPASAHILLSNQKGEEIKVMVRNGSSIATFFATPDSRYTLVHVDVDKSKLKIKKAPVIHGFSVGAYNYALTLNIVSTGFIRRLTPYNNEEYFEEAQKQFKRHFPADSESRSFVRLPTENTVEKAELISF